MPTQKGVKRGGTSKSTIIKLGGGAWIDISGHPWLIEKANGYFRLRDGAGITEREGKEAQRFIARLIALYNRRKLHEAVGAVRQIEEELASARRYVEELRGDCAST